MSKVLLATLIQEQFWTSWILNNSMSTASHASQETAHSNMLRGSATSCQLARKSSGSSDSIRRVAPHRAPPKFGRPYHCKSSIYHWTYCGGPWIWGWQNCTSRAQKLEPHLLVKVHNASAPWLNHCRSQCNIRLAAEIDIVIFEWQQGGVGKQRLSNSYLKTGAGKAEVEQ